MSELIPCPACRQTPYYETDGTAGWVECVCGIRGPEARDVPLECFAPGTSHERALRWDAEREWDEMDAHGLATGGESPWLVAVVALRDRITAERKQARAEAESAATQIRALSQERDEAIRTANASRDALRVEQLRNKTLSAELETLRAKAGARQATREKQAGAGRFEMLEIDT